MHEWAELNYSSQIKEIYLMVVTVCVSVCV